MQEKEPWESDDAAPAAAAVEPWERKAPAAAPAAPAPTAAAAPVENQNMGAPGSVPPDAPVWKMTLGEIAQLQPAAPAAPAAVHTPQQDNNFLQNMVAGGVAQVHRLAATLHGAAAAGAATATQSQSAQTEIDRNALRLLEGMASGDGPALGQGRRIYPELQTPDQILAERDKVKARLAAQEQQLAGDQTAVADRTARAADLTATANNEVQGIEGTVGARVGAGIVGMAPAIATTLVGVPPALAFAGSDAAQQAAQVAAGEQKHFDPLQVAVNGLMGKISEWVPVFAGGSTAGKAVAATGNFVSQAAAMQAVQTIGQLADGKQVHLDELGAEALVNVLTLAIMHGSGKLAEVPGRAQLHIDGMRSDAHAVAEAKARDLVQRNLQGAADARAELRALLEQYATPEEGGPGLKPVTGGALEEAQHRTGKQYPAIEKIEPTAEEKQQKMLAASRPPDLEAERKANFLKALKALHETVQYQKRQLGMPETPWSVPPTFHDDNGMTAPGGSGLQPLSPDVLNHIRETSLERGRGDAARMDTRPLQMLRPPAHGPFAETGAPAYDLNEVQALPPGRNMLPPDVHGPFAAPEMPAYPLSDVKVPPKGLLPRSFPQVEAARPPPAELPAHFTDPNHPELLALLQKYLPPEKWGGPAERLSLGNNWKALRDKAAEKPEIGKQKAEIQQEPPPPMEAPPPPKVAPAAPAADKKPVFQMRPGSRSTWNSETPGREAKLHGDWIVADVREIRTGEHPDYPAELQPRNRDTQASKDQIASIAMDPRAERLGAAPTTGGGAPYIDERGHVISGNGRTMGLRQAYAGGRAEGYRAEILKQAKALGLDASGIEQPVLVHRIKGMEQGKVKGKPTLAQVAEWSNRPEILHRTQAEVAEADARAITDGGLIHQFAPDEAGKIRAASNGGFLRAFVHATGDASLMDSKGEFAPEIEPRVRRAMLAAVLGGSEHARKTIADLVERADAYGITRQRDGIMAAAGPLVRAWQDKPDYDLSAHLTRAIKDLIEYKRLLEEGKIKSLEDYLRQGEMFDTGRTDLSMLLFEELVGRPTIKATRTYLEIYARKVQAIDTKTPDMFGGKPPAATDILKGAIHEGKNLDVGPTAADQGQAGGLPPRGPGATPGGGGKPPEVKPAAGEPPADTSAPPVDAGIANIHSHLEDLDALLGLPPKDRTKFMVGPGVPMRNRLESMLDLPTPKNDEHGALVIRGLQATARKLLSRLDYNAGEGEIRAEFDKAIQTAEDAMASKAAKEQALAKQRADQQQKNLFDLPPAEASLFMAGARASGQGNPKDVLETARSKRNERNTDKNTNGQRWYVDDQLEHQRALEQAVAGFTPEERAAVGDIKLENDFSHIDHDRHQAERNASARGLKLHFVRCDPRIDGFYRDGECFINVQGMLGRPIVAADHELAHHADRLGDPRIKALKEQVDLASPAAATVRKTYERIFKRAMSDEDVRMEIVSNFVGGLPKFYDHAIIDAFQDKAAAKKLGSEFLTDPNPEGGAGGPGGGAKFMAEEDKPQDWAKIINAAARAVAASARKLNVQPDAKFAQQMMKRYADHLAGRWEEIAQAAGEILKTGEDLLSFGVRKGKLDETGNGSGAAGAVGGGELPSDRTGSESVNAGANGTPGGGRGRTDLRVAGKENLPKPRDYVAVSRYGTNLAEDQRLAVNLAIQRFDPGSATHGRGFLVGDGPGVGKTRIILAVAQHILDKGGRVLIITPNETIYKGSFLKDAQVMGINLEKFDLATYTSAVQGKRLSDIRIESTAARKPLDETQHYDLVIFDEAQNLKNGHTDKTITGMNLVRNAEHVMFVTATPLDRAQGAAYFMSEITGMPQERIADLCGFVFKKFIDKKGQPQQVAVLAPGKTRDEVCRNIAKLRNGAVAQGALIRREYPFLGSFHEITVMPRAEDLEIEHKMQAYYDGLKAIGKGFAGGQHTMSQHHFAESCKIAAGVERALASIKEGRRVVIFASKIEESDRLRRPDPVVREMNGVDVLDDRAGKIWDATLEEEHLIPGIIKGLEAALDKAGIKFGKIYGGDPAVNARELAKFNKNEETKALVMTTRSGGAGISADDTVGSFPRDAIFLHNIMEGDVFDQAVFRISRRTTQSDSRCFFVNMKGMFGDERAAALRREHLQALVAIQEGSDIDQERFKIEDETTVRGTPEAPEAAASAETPMETDPAPRVGRYRSRGVDLVGVPESAVRPAGRIERADRASDLGDAPPGAPLGKPGTEVKAPRLNPADDPNFSVYPIEEPELVKLAKDLNGGMYPQIVEKIRALGGRALGVFIAHPATGHMEIRIRADVFQLVSAREVSRLADEALKWATATEKIDGGDVAQLAKERLQELYEAARAKAMKENPRLAMKVIAHELGHMVDALPEIAASRGNILGHLKSFKGAWDKSMAGMPDQPEQLFTDKERAGIRGEAAKQARQEIPKGSPNRQQVVDARTAAIYAKNLQQAATDRGLVTRAEVIKEAEKVIAWWRGSAGTMEDYFKDPAEMYAEMFSVICNNPAALAKRAPKFWSMWNAWLKEKPEVADKWVALGNALKAGTARKDIVMDLRASFEAGAHQVAMQEAALLNRTPREWVDGIMGTMFRGTWPITQRARNINEATYWKVRGAAQDYLYRHAAERAYMFRVANEVLPHLRDNNLTWTDFLEYLFHQRIRSEPDKAGSLGFNAKVSGDRLAEMKGDLGTERYQALDRAATAFATARREEVLDLLRSTRTLSEKQLDEMENHTRYVTFQTQRGMTVDQARAHEAQQHIDMEMIMGKWWGPSFSGSHLFRRIGFLGPVIDPVLATLRNDMSLMNLAFRTRAMREVADDLRRDPATGHEWVPAPKRFNGRFMEAQEPQSNRLKLYSYLRDGEWEHFHVPESLANWIDHEEPQQLMMFKAISSAISTPIKNLFTRWNPGFSHLVLPMRNKSSSRMQLPGMTMMGERSYRAFQPAARKSAQSLIEGKPDADALEMLRRGLMPTYFGRFEDRPGALALESFAHRMGVDLHLQDQARSVFDTWRARLSKEFEKVDQDHAEAKIVGMKYLDKFFPDMPQDQKNVTVRDAAGAAAYRDTPLLGSEVPLLTVFYNALLRHGEAFYDAWRSPATGRPFGSGEMWMNILKTVALPAILYQVARRGLLGGDDKDQGTLSEFGAMMRAIPRYDSDTKFVVPLFWYDRAAGKVAYVKGFMNPISESLYHAFSQILRALPGPHQDTDVGTGSVVGSFGAELPSAQPLWNVGAAWHQYLQTGTAPVDWHTGQPVMTAKQATAGAGSVFTQAGGQLAMYSWNQLGGSAIDRLKVNNYMEPQKGMLERILAAPLISSTVGRVFAISNMGTREKIMAVERAQASQAARNSQRVDALMEKVNTGAPLTQIEALELASLDPRGSGAKARAQAYQLKQQAPPLMAETLRRGQPAATRAALGNLMNEGRAPAPTNQAPPRL